MEIIWDKEKDEWLKTHRSASFQEIAELLLEGRYLDILENPGRDGQLYFVIPYQSYTWLVPFLIDDGDRIVLKTAFPSRKFQKIYGGN